MGRRKPNPPGINQTAMRNAERFYKQNTSINIQDNSVFLKHIYISHDAFNDNLKIHGFNKYPGMFLIKDAIKKDTQKSIVLDCLNQSKSPNVTNLDTHYEIPSQGIWDIYSKDQQYLLNLRPDSQNVILENDGRQIDPPTNSRPWLVGNTTISSKAALRKLRWTSLGVQCMI